MNLNLEVNQQQKDKILDITIQNNEFAKEINPKMLADILGDMKEQLPKGTAVMVFDGKQQSAAYDINTGLRVYYVYDPSPAKDFGIGVAYEIEGRSYDPLHSIYKGENQFCMIAEQFENSRYILKIW